MKPGKVLLQVLLFMVYLVLADHTGDRAGTWYTSYYDQTTYVQDVYVGWDHVPGFMESFLAPFRSLQSLLFYLLTASVTLFAVSRAWMGLLRQQRRFVFLKSILIITLLLLIIRFLMECLVCLVSHRVLYWDYAFGGHIMAIVQACFYFVFACWYTARKLRRRRKAASGPVA